MIERCIPRINSHNLLIVTSETSEYRVFIFIDSDVLPEHKLVVIGSSDAFDLGVLSSTTHVKWAIAAGGRRGVGDTPVYSKTKCFDPFPFPDPTPEQKQKIRDLGERLHAHRKQVQAAHPDITITGMYNLLEKLRAGEAFTDSDRDYNNRALVSTLKQIHDELDVAVLEAYGWDDLVGLPTPNSANQPTPSPSEGGEPDKPNPRQGANPLSGGVPVGRGGSLDDLILERLVALNAQRAEEERNGLIRWLRPDYQNPGQAPDEMPPQQTTLDVVAKEEPVVEPVEQQKWPTQPKAQLAAIRDLLRPTPGDWTAKQIAAQFKGRTTQKKLDAITENLERLEWFGLVIPETRDGLTYWHFADSAKAA